MLFMPSPQRPTRTTTSSHSTPLSTSAPCCAIHLELRVQQVGAGCGLCLLQLVGDAVMAYAAVPTTAHDAWVDDGSSVNNSDNKPADEEVDDAAHLSNQPAEPFVVTQRTETRWLLLAAPAVLLIALVAWAGWPLIRDGAFMRQPAAVPSAADGQFWWLQPSLNRWAQARYLHDTLRFHPSLEPAAAIAAAHTPPQPPPSQYYTQLLYDPLRALPLLPATPYGARRIAGSMALRHVRLAGGKLHIHLPSAQLIPPHTTAPQSEYQHGEYDVELRALGHAFEPYDARRAHWMRPPRSLAAGDSWLNSTRWPVPSTCMRREAGGQSTEEGEWSGDADAATEAASSFDSPSCCCRATQWDHPSHSHGRLPYQSDPLAMLASNDRALRSLHARLQLDRARGSNDSDALLNLNSFLAVRLPLELHDGPLDYADRAQCEVVLDNAYFAAALRPRNVWHASVDYGLPLHSLLHDPCFFPLHSPVDLRTGEPVNRSSAETSSEQYAAGSSDTRMPESPFCPSAHIPRRDAYIVLSDAAAVGSLWERSFTQHSYVRQRRADGQWPHLTSLDALLAMNVSLCVQDAVVGVPWYYHVEQMQFEAVDEVRQQWEQHRVNALMRHVEAELTEEHTQAAAAASTSTSTSSPPLLTTRRRLASERSTRGLSDEADFGVSAAEAAAELNETATLATQIPPTPFPQPPDFLVWAQEHNISHAATMGGALAQVHAARPAPLSASESAALLESIDYYMRLREQPQSANMSSPLPSAPPRLRLLYIARPQRKLAEEEAVLSAAREAGFEVEAGDFRPLVSAEAWVRHLNWLRSFHVVLGVHGAGLTHVLGMLPGARSLLVELFPNCWPFHWFRLSYTNKLARHAQVRAFGLVTPCARTNTTTPQQIGSGSHSNRTEPASRAEVELLFGELFRYWHDHFLDMPERSSKSTPVPLIQLS